MSDVIQQELDNFEKEFFTMLFGQNYENSNKFKLVSVMYGNKINDTISQFEAFARPLMLDNGLVDTSKVRQLVEIKYPQFVHLIPQQNFRLVDLLQIVRALLP